MTPDRYAVFGNPVAHSRSPQIHAAFARQTGQRMTYEKLLAPLDGFGVALRAFIAAGGQGANVTLPFKLEAHAAATSLTSRAAAAGAVNTLQFKDGAIIGDNTDGVGLVTDLQANAGVVIRGKRVLLLGAGGAAQGVLSTLLQAQPVSLVIANRTPAKAIAVAARFNRALAGLDAAGAGGTAACALVACTLSALNAPFDIIINATAASLTDEAPLVSPAIFGVDALAYDMVYAAAPTAFMRLAARHGASVRDGLGMLVEQAAESFAIWRGVRPATAAVLASLRAAP